MSHLAITDFWKLLIESRLLSPEQCHGLSTEFGGVKGASGQGNAKTLSEWLISRNVLSRYQATILLAGRSGPFFYGDYKVFDRVEGGRLANQFRAVHAATNHPVLLEFLTGAVTQDATLWAAAATRAQAQCEMVDANLQRFFEPVDLVSFKFMVGEDLQGQTLGEQLASGALPAAEACRVIRLAAIGLGRLHQSGDAHGDVRPRNLWIEPGGNVKLLRDPVNAPAAISFGQADPTGDMLSRADYLAPEFTQPGKKPDPLTDIYALGCSLFELLTGRPPFAGGDMTQKLQRHAKEAIQPLEQFGVPQPVAQLVAYMMAKNPSVRYQQVSIVAEQITPFVNPAQLHVAPPAPAASLPAYESWVQQKQAALSSQAASQPAAAASAAPIPAIDTGIEGTATRRSGTPKIQVADSPISTTGDGTGTAASPRNYAEEAEKKQTKKVAMGLGIAAVLLIGGLVTIQMLGGGTTPVEDPLANNGPDNVGPNPVNNVVKGNGDSGNSTNGNDSTNTDVTDDDDDTTEDVATQQIVPDDGELLWASPTDGQPISFRYMPPGVQVIFVLRPAEMLATPEGERVFEAMGPEFESMRRDWESSAGFEFADIKQLIVRLHDNGQEFPRPSFVVRPRENISRDDLLAKWGSFETVKEDSDKYYTSGGWAYYVPESDADPLFVMGHAEEIKASIEFGGASPPLNPSISRLRKTSDDQRHFTMFITPHSVATDVLRDGRKLFFGEPRKLREPIGWLLDETINAAMVSMHFDGDFYTEVRFDGRLDKDKHTLASDFRNRLNEVPAKMKRYIADLSPDRYWNEVAISFPPMIGFLHRHTRIAVEGDQAVVNSRLPLQAAHNIVFASELTLMSTPGVRVAVDTPKETGPKSMDELLATKMDMSFDQKSLEFAMRDVGLDVNDTYADLPFKFDVKIIGADLEKNGLTRNQQVRDVKVVGKPVADVLTAIVVTAMATGKPANDPAQKMIWVVGPDPEDPGTNIVLVTTRDAAAAKNYTLPDVFK